MPRILSCLQSRLRTRIELRPFRRTWGRMAGMSTGRSRMRRASGVIQPIQKARFPPIHAPSGTFQRNWPSAIGMEVADIPMSGIGRSIGPAKRKEATRGTQDRRVREELFDLRQEAPPIVRPFRTVHDLANGRLTRGETPDSLRVGLLAAMKLVKRREQAGRAVARPRRWLRSPLTSSPGATVEV